MPRPISGTNIERFWRKTKANGTCIEISGWKDKNGYGRFAVRLNKRRKGRRTSSRYLTVIAHRWIYTQVLGDPGDRLVMHSCDNPPCVALQHLSPGTPTTNYWDSVSKGRDSGHGEKHASAKITWKDVNEIRRSPATNRQLAQRYGISEGQIHNIRRRKQWKGRSTRG